MDLKNVGQSAWKFTKAVGKGLIDGLNRGLEAVEEVNRKTEKWRAMDISNQREEITIDAQMAKQIRWMSSGQLKAIFQGKRVTTDNDPETWKQLRWMGEDQLEMIFGRKE